jgi:HEAT repeat protein
MAYDCSALLAHLRDSGGGIDPHEAVRGLATFALGGPPARERLAQLDEFLGSLGGTVTDDRVKALLCLIGAMPEFQLC